MSAPLRDELETLRLRCWELELANDWYLQRIHELEAYVGALGRDVPPAGETSRRTPRKPRADSGDDSASERHLEKIRLFEVQLQALERELAEKEGVIAQLASTAEARRRQLEEKEGVIAELAAACEERQALILRLTAGDAAAQATEAGG